MILEFNEQLQKQFDKMCQTGVLFRSRISGSDVWKAYLQSFPKEQDPIFRDPQSSSHNCNTCHNFIRRYGNIVALDNDLKIMTLFDVEGTEEFKAPAEALSKLIGKYPIDSIFFETFQELNSLPYEACSKTNTKFKLGIVSNLKREVRGSNPFLLTITYKTNTMYKEATRLKLRFNTTKGNLSVEQLWDLSLEDLDATAVALEKNYKESGKKSFLVKKSTKDKEAKLAFDIVLDVLTTKVEEAAAARDAKDIKEHNQKILTLIKEKKEDELKNLGISELEKMLK